MTVTRQRLTVPPEPEVAAHRWEIPAVPVVSREAPEVDCRQIRDRLKVIGYFCGRTGQPLDLLQAVTATRLPTARLLEAIDALVEAGSLERAGMRRTPFGHAQTWVRLDPGEQPMSANHTRRSEARRQRERRRRRDPADALSPETIPPERLAEVTRTQRERFQETHRGR